MAAASLACGTTSPLAEADHLRDLLAFHRDNYRKVLDLDNRMVVETRQWLAGPIATEPRSYAGTEARRMGDRWVPVHVGYRWLAQEVAKQEYRSARVREVHQKIVKHLRDRQFRALEFEHLAYDAYRHGFRNTAIGFVPKEAERMKILLDKHPRAEDHLTAFLSELN
jgi:hypothetical protein